MQTLRDRAPDPPEVPDSPVAEIGLEDRLTPDRPASHRRESPEETRRVGLGLILGVLGVAVVLSVTLAITIGPVYISPITVWQIILSHILGTPQGDWTAGQDHIVWLIRLPRVLLAGVVGAGLAVVGVAMQATVRNPLADPYLLGNVLRGLGRSRPGHNAGDQFSGALFAFDTGLRWRCGILRHRLCRFPRPEAASRPLG